MAESANMNLFKHASLKDGQLAAVEIWFPSWHQKEREISEFKDFHSWYNEQVLQDKLKEYGFNTIVPFYLLDVQCYTVNESTRDRAAEWPLSAVWLTVLSAFDWFFAGRRQRAAIREHFPFAVLAASYGYRRRNSLLHYEVSGWKIEWKK